MAGNQREVAIAIGVADAKPLDYLGGAVNGAHAFHDWATKSGYDSRLITDETLPVTVARLRAELESALEPKGEPIHRLLLYFAGHGLIREAEEGLWLLSDWKDELRAVAVEVLKRRLYMHNIQQIAIFADSCRSLPADIQTSDLTADPVLGAGPVRGQKKQPAIDKFVAAQDGATTFMVPGKNPADDRCLFSGVLMEGLWGAKREAFSTVLPGKVTSSSLGAYLDAEVPRLSERYRHKLFPVVIPAFPEGDNIYLDADRPLTPPVFPEWPEPGPAGAMGPSASGKEEEGIAESLLTRFTTFGYVRPQLDVEGLYDVSAADDIDDRRRPARPTPTPAPPPPPPPAAQPAASVDETAGAALLATIRSQPRPPGFETGSGFAVQGGSVLRIWTPGDVTAEQHGEPGWWRVCHRGQPQLVDSAPVLIEFEDEMFAAVVVLPRFIATLLRDQRGVSALIYRGVWERPDTAEVAEDAIARMESGSLRAAMATDLAAGLRQMKHTDPVLGVISAYLYDSAGDVDNIRRMAYFYVVNSQPIPYDIALLAQLDGEWRGGRLWAQVPEVDGRDPRTDAERANPWTHSRTPAIAGAVGGLWPWMRQGWTFLDDPSDEGSPLIRSGLAELIGHLKSGRFATLDAEGGRELARIFDLAPGWTRPAPGR